eukprot:1923315-Prymnesium_polylepis.2
MAMRSARKAAARPPSSDRRGDQWSPCRYRLAARLGPERLLQAALREPVAGGKPMSVVKNLSRGLVDGGAEPHDVTDDAGDRAGSLDDDEQRAA